MGPSPRAQPVEAMAFSETLASGLEKRRHGFCAQCNCAAGTAWPIRTCRRMSTSRMPAAGWRCRTSSGTALVRACVS